MQTAFELRPRQPFTPRRELLSLDVAQIVTTFLAVAVAIIALVELAVR